MLFRSGGVVKSRSRLPSTLLFAITHAVFVLWLPEPQIRLSCLYETFIATVLYMLIPPSIQTRIKQLIFVPVTPEADYSSKTRLYIKKRLSETCLAFRELRDMVFDVDDKTDNGVDMSVIFDNAAERVCRSCSMLGVCWERDYTTTLNTLNAASAKISRRGRALREDFQGYFLARCIKFSEFLPAINEAMTTKSYSVQYQKKLAENHGLMCRQYDSLSDVLGDVIGSVSKGPGFDNDAAIRVRKHLLAQGVEPGAVLVYSDNSGRLHVEIEGPDLSVLIEEREAYIEEISAAVGRQMGTPEEEVGSFGWKIKVSERETYKASIGVGLLKKRGEKVSGDYESFFRTSEGQLYIIISDGMGSGEEAANESAAVSQLLERFLHAGIGASGALRLIDAACATKNNPMFATLDVAGVNLFTGETEIHKYGASPSYIKSGVKLTRVLSGALPAGMNGEPCKTLQKFRLDHGDFIVMITDGIADSQNDAWLRDTLTAYSGRSPKELASGILEKASKLENGRDDMSVLVMRLERRKRRDGLRKNQSFTN